MLGIPPTIRSLLIFVWLGLPFVELFLDDGIGQGAFVHLSKPAVPMRGHYLVTPVSYWSRHHHQRVRPIPRPMQSPAGLEHGIGVGLDARFVPSTAHEHDGLELRFDVVFPKDGHPYLALLRFEPYRSAWITCAHEGRESMAEDARTVHQEHARVFLRFHVASHASWNRTEASRRGSLPFLSIEPASRKGLSFPFEPGSHRVRFLLSKGTSPPFTTPPKREGCSDVVSRRFELRFSDVYTKQTLPRSSRCQSLRCLPLHYETQSNPAMEWRSERNTI